MRLRIATLGLLVVVGAFAVVAACGTSSSSTFPNGGPDASDEGGGPEGGIFPPSPTTFTDFPPPIIDPTAGDGGVTAPPNAQALFGDPTSGAPSGGPCLVEPEVTSMFPQNWLRPRFHWLASAGENLFELRLHVANQTQDLLVYTASPMWTMPAPLWTLLTEHSPDVDMTMTVRGGVFAAGALTGVSLGSTGPMRIAPVPAPGSIVYWNTTTKSLFGFKVGDESVVPVMKPAQFTERAIDCVGCHSSSPDGNYVQISTKIENPLDLTTQYAEGIVDIDVATQGTTASFVGAGAKLAMAQPLRGFSTFSTAHWAPGDRIMLTESAAADPGTSGEISWIDLEATTLGAATGTLARTGDTGPIAMVPSWSHDGQHVTYVSCAQEVDARPDLGPGDLYTIPYNAHAGGAATAVPGASTTDFEENYPSYSPDDKFLAFTRVPKGDNMLFSKNKEVLVIPAEGGTATRLAANDPPTCTGVTSPGMWNSYAKWAPGVTTASGRTYYWVVFSSKRNSFYPGAAGAATSKLFLTPITIEPDGSIKTYGALYLWIQGDAEDNHTPAWDVFKTPAPN